MAPITYKTYDWICFTIYCYVPSSKSTEQANVSIEKIVQKCKSQLIALANSIKGIMETTLITINICQK